MRNLKRVLSLTLASVMLLGMMVVGASAADYTDVDYDNDNVEAIEVLNAIEVMVGYPEDGNFHPDDPVTRAEMMVIVAKLLNLDYDYYVSSCPFTDVPDWAKGYVGAAYANKIAAGRGNGIFDPNSTVTPVEASAFLMRVLGYFQYDSDYADGFETATVRQGSKIRIYDGIGSNASAPMTRNQVAQMTLNALRADVVDAEDNTLHITTGEGAGNINITGGQVNYVVRVSSADFAKAIDSDDSSGSGTDGRLGNIVQLGEQLYNGDLKRTRTDDVFGAPATRWVYKNNEIGTYADEADLSYIKEVKLSDIYKDLGLSKKIDTTDNDLKLKEDGGADKTTANEGKTLELSSSAEGKVGHKGSLTRVYHVKDGKVQISVVNYYLAEASEDYDSGDKEVDVEVRNDDISGALTSKTLKLDDFANITSVREGDYLVVTVADDEIMSVDSPEVVSDVTVSAARKNDYVTAGGTKYEYNGLSAKSSETGALGYDFMSDPSLYSLNDKGYNLYLDPCGYVLGVEAVDGSANVGDYVFIKDTQNSGFDVVAKAVFADGTSGTITVSKLDGDTTVFLSDDHPAALDGEKVITTNEFYTFKTNSKGSYELTTVLDKDDPDAEGKASQGSVDNAYLDDKAQPIRSQDDDTAAVPNSANDRTVFIAKDKAYVGVKNAPETSKTADKTVYYVLDKNNRLLIVYIDQKGSNSANPEDVVYILSNDAAVTKSGDDTYYEYTAVVNGEKTTSFATVSNSWTKGLYVIETYTDDRADTMIKVNGDHVTEGLAIYAGIVDGANGKTELKNGTLTLDYGVKGDPYSFLVRSGAKIRTIESTTVKNISASGVKNAVMEDDFQEVYLVETSGTDSDIGTIYLVKTDEDETPDRPDIYGEADPGEMKVPDSDLGEALENVYVGPDGAVIDYDVDEEGGLSNPNRRDAAAKIGTLTVTLGGSGKVTALSFQPTIIGTEDENGDEITKVTITVVVNGLKVEITATSNDEAKSADSVAAIANEKPAIPAAVGTITGTEIQNATINSELTGNGRIPVVDENYDLIGWITVEDGVPTEIEGEGDNTVKNGAVVTDQKDNEIYKSDESGNLDEAEKTDLTSLTVTLEAPSEGKAVGASVAYEPEEADGTDIDTVWVNEDGESVEIGDTLAAGEYTVTVTVTLDPLYQVGDETTVNWEGVVEDYELDDTADNTDLEKVYTIEVEGDEDPVYNVTVKVEGGTANEKTEADYKLAAIDDDEDKVEMTGEGASYTVAVTEEATLKITDDEDNAVDNATIWVVAEGAEAVYDDETENAWTITLDAITGDESVPVTITIYVLDEKTEDKTTSLTSSEGAGKTEAGDYYITTPSGLQTMTGKNDVGDVAEVLLFIFTPTANKGSSFVMYNLTEDAEMSDPIDETTREDPHTGTLGYWYSNEQLTEENLYYVVIEDEDSATLYEWYIVAPSAD